MHIIILASTLSLALARVNASPVHSKSYSEVGPVSGFSQVARALPSGDLYPPQPPGAGPGKRGLLYDSHTKVGWSDFYVSSHFVTYGSNGDVVRGDGINALFSYVPTIAVDSKLENSEWKDLVPVLIEGGTKAMFA